MKRFLLLFLASCMALTLSAQEEHLMGGIIGAMMHPENEKAEVKKAAWKTPVEEKYLAGAVPTVDGKVVFSRTIELSKDADLDKAFTSGKQWVANTLSKDPQAISRRSINIDPAAHCFALHIEQWITFTNKKLALDRTRVYYTLNVKMEDTKVMLTFSDITYLYEEERTPQELTAEEQITDEAALQKNGKSFYRTYGKFRTGTIDMVDAVTESLAEALK